MKTLPLIRTTTSLLLVASAVGCALDTDPSVRTREEEVIWGDASRIRYSQATSAQQELATAVGMLVWSDQLTDLGGACPNVDTGTSFDCTTELTVYTPAQLRARGEVPMCDDGLVEDGLDPVDALACTAFMIGPDTFATAGHCIVPDGFGVSIAEQRTECHERTVVMRWRESDDSSFPLGNPNILDRHIYRCVEVLEHGGARFSSQGAGEPNDWAIFRVDRPVSGGTGTGGPLTPAREPLEISTDGVTTGQTDLMTIGHSYGRPLRIDPEVTVAQASSPDTTGAFEMEADGAPGLSGGPVLDDTGAVVGIVISGPSLVEIDDPDAPGFKCLAECSADVGSIVCQPGATGLRTMRAAKISSLPTEYQPFAASCSGRTPGSASYCSAACPCTAGEGHCDSNAECADGLNCLAGVGPLFGQGPSVNVCAVPACSGVVSGDVGACGETCQCGEGGQGCDQDWDCQMGLHCVGATSGIANGVCRALTCEVGDFGSGSFCSGACSCQHGAGDCDSNAECATGLVCGTDHGPMFGMGRSTDVCLPSACAAGVTGSGAYCSSSCPCGYGGGDCDGSGQCLPGLVCGSDHGPMFKMSAATDVCLPSACSEKVIGSGSYCSAECPCGQGGGDCDNDAQCMPGLVCGTDHGPMFKMSAATDVCLPSACAATTVGSSAYCTEECPCGHGGGDCDASAECLGGLTCATDHGKAFGMSAATDVCLPSACAGATLGSGSYCSTTCPCGHGGGDCDSNAECLPGLTCRDNNGASFGYSASTDVCAP